jgi:leucyl aminopeptidase
MRVRAESASPSTVQADVLAVPIYKEDREIAGELADLDRASGGAITRAIDWGEFNLSEHYSALIDAGDLPVDRLLLVNGVRRGRGPWRARRIASVATRRLQGRGAPRLALWLRDGEDDDAYTAAVVGAVQGTYRPMDLYGRVRDTAAMKRHVEELIVLNAPSQELLDRALIVAEGVEFGRDLANRAANDLYPERMAEVARTLEDDGCSVEVLDPDQMRALGMGALLGVGQGATHGPRLIAIKLPGWEKASADRRLAIVGKGVCFDSGGISIKPSAAMEEMKHDKCGAAAVIAAARTLARLDPDVPVMAVAPMVENMPGGNAQRPGESGGE